MNLRAATKPTALAIGAARLYGFIGWQGSLGILLLLCGALMLHISMRAHQRGVVMESQLVSDAPAAGGASKARPIRVVAPLAEQVPTLLTRIQRTATEYGLTWARADYRLQPPRADMPAALEVRCAPTGSYIAIRKFVAALLLDNPTLTLREFDLDRPSAEASTIQAKLTIVVYLTNESNGSRGIE